MDIFEKTRVLNPGTPLPANMGFGLRIAGDQAKNDGILGNLEIGYQSQIFLDRFSTESGTTIDLFGETSHFGAYFQLNYHPHRSWIIGLRGAAGGVSDEKERSANGGDEQDFGFIAHGAAQVSYRLDEHFFLGMRGGMEWQVYGKSGGDQGTQASLMGFLNLAYHF